MLSEEEALEIIKNHLIRQFPKQCNCCGKMYRSAEEFIRNTTYAGEPVSYDLDMDSTQPSDPIGTVGHANCSCGTTLAITSQGMGIKTLWKLLIWARAETKKQGISPSDLLSQIRHKIDQSILLKDSEK